MITTHECTACGGDGRLVDSLTGKPFNVAIACPGCDGLGKMFEVECGNLGIRGPGSLFSKIGADFVLMESKAMKALIDEFREWINEERSGDRCIMCGLDKTTEHWYVGDDTGKLCSKECEDACERRASLAVDYYIANEELVEEWAKDGGWLGD